MSFTLIQVTQRAGGGEIVRTKRIEASELLIGRGADCDLQLPDLAVGLRHARMVQTGAGKVSVEALAGQSFEAGGRFVGQASLKAADRPTLVFGSHVLTLAPGAGPDDIQINVARVEPPAAASEVDEEVRTFAPGAVGFSKRALAWILGSLIVALCLAWPITLFYTHQNPTIHADQQWSGGPLSKSHAFLEKDCQSCHQKAFVAVRDEACLSCHQAGRPVADRLAAAARARAKGSPEAPKFVLDHAAHDRLLAATPLPADWGGKVKAVFERAFNHSETRCASCHREHLDAEGKKTAAGTRPGPRPDKPALTLVQDCAACHGKLKARLSDTTLIDTPDWNRHPDFRPLITVSLSGAKAMLARIPLAQAPSEPTGVKFPHRLHLMATGGVARMGQVLGSGRGYGGALTCASCHRPDATGAGFLPVSMTRDCAACHSLAFAREGGQVKLLPHDHPDQVVATLQAYYSRGTRWNGPGAAPAALPRRLPGQAATARLETRRLQAWTPSPGATAGAIAAVFSPGGACFDCHTVQRPTAPGSIAWGIAPVRLNSRYLTRGAFDHSVRAHRLDKDGRETCNDCHKAATSDRSEDLLLPRIDQCVACHGKTAAQSKTPAASDCAECHSYHAPPLPSRPVAEADKWILARPLRN